MAGVSFVASGAGSFLLRLWTIVRSSTLMRHTKVVPKRRFNGVSIENGVQHSGCHSKERLLSHKRVSIESAEVTDESWHKWDPTGDGNGSYYSSAMKHRAAEHGTV